MRSILLTALIYCSLPVAAKPDPGGSLSSLLSHYYSLKDALVDSDPSAAAARAGELLSAINDVDTKSLSGSDRQIFVALQPKLAYDARHISEVKAIDHQREHFASLSANMYKLAKAVRLSAAPIYELYCPMRRSYWLSDSETIRNPYYGKKMPTCGKLAEKL